MLWLIDIYWSKSFRSAIKMWINEKLLGVLPHYDDFCGFQKKD